MTTANQNDLTDHMTAGSLASEVETEEEDVMVNPVFIFSRIPCLIFRLGYLIDLLLSPLHAASIATTSFLRRYATAQHRLETLLRSTDSSSTSESRRWGKNTNFKTGSLTIYSELLWSQFIHLRGSLPTSESSRSIVGKKNGGWGTSSARWSSEK